MWYMSSGLGGWSGLKPKGCRLPLMYDRKISVQVQFDAHVCGVVGGSAKNSGRQYAYREIAHIYTQALCKCMHVCDKQHTHTNTHTHL